MKQRIKATTLLLLLPQQRFIITPPSHLGRMTLMGRCQAAKWDLELDRTVNSLIIEGFGTFPSKNSSAFSMKWMAYLVPKAKARLFHPQCLLICSLSNWILSRCWFGSKDEALEIHVERYDKENQSAGQLAKGLLVRRKLLEWWQLLFNTRVMFQSLFQVKMLCLLESCVCDLETIHLMKKNKIVFQWSWFNWAQELCILHAS